MGKDENVDRKHVHIFLVLLKHNIIILVLCLKTCNCALHGRVTLTLSHWVEETFTLESLLHDSTQQHLTKIAYRRKT